jgi:hypothetical protein
MGCISKPIDFKLESITDNVVDGSIKAYSVSCGWFEIIEVGHEKKNLEFVVPLEHPEYSDEMEDVLLGLEPNDTLRMRWISENRDNTAWRVFEIVDEDV